jgi:carboxypeptidase Taq
MICTAISIGSILVPSASTRTRHLISSMSSSVMRSNVTSYSGTLSVDDLPKIWNQKYRDYLGVNITNNRDGVLQDVHWAKGYFGYFPAYALGSMNAAQLEAAMRRDHPDLNQKFASGDFTILATWMEEHVYKYGAIYDTPELMKKATGNETDTYDFLNYL